MNFHSRVHLLHWPTPTKKYLSKIKISVENAHFLFASWYQRVHFLEIFWLLMSVFDQIKKPVVIVVHWTRLRRRVSPSAVPYPVRKVDDQPCNDLDYLHLSILTVMSAECLHGQGHPAQMSLAYRHPGQELGPGLYVQASHQVHVEEDWDARHEGDAGHLTRTLLRTL